MSWIGKVIGGALGGIVGGPVGAAAGAGIGHLVDNASGASPGLARASGPVVRLGDMGFEPSVGPGGPGWVLKVATEFSGPVKGGVVLFRLSTDRGYIKARHASYADEEGDLTLGGVFQQEENGAIWTIAFLPFAAVPARAPREVSCEAAAFDNSGACLGKQEWTFRLPGKEGLLGNSLASLAGSAAGLSRACGGLSKSGAARLRARLKDLFELDEVGSEALRRIQKEAEARPPAAEEIAACFADEPQEVQRGVLEFLIDVAGAEETPANVARRFISDVAAGLRVPAETLEELGLGEEPSEADPLAAHYAVLELEPGTGWPSVKQAYRRLAAEYHPDKVSTLPKGFQQFATEKMKAINAAYEMLREALEA